ncbi:protein MIZU-KUSSEI 1-like [Elaeis guineensis]|uniref:Protein MIZU-KUSSEI 1-like n=1 Tax=Elaeis guineensis var. tenera TaxID=51953 RepID=A0A6I9S493_ELAGV|nr:protein MIZU-KUSSEI 1-like [Elaeis guineensis]
MKTIMARTSHDPSSSSSSSSSSKIPFQRIRKGSDQGERMVGDEEAKKKASSAAEAVSRLRSVLTAAIPARWSRPVLTGTLFGHRRGHVNLAFQVDARSSPAVLVELATPTSTLVREMASGLARIALECERKEEKTTARTSLLEEPLWRAYCNGRKCGYAVRRECGPADWKVLRALEPVSMGAGVLPGDDPDGDIMYMRARFERVVGSKDSEAFYMINPDGNTGPELSVYLLRV